MSNFPGNNDDEFDLNDVPGPEYYKQYEEDKKKRQQSRRKILKIGAVVLGSIIAAGYPFLEPLVELKILESKLKKYKTELEKINMEFEGISFLEIIKNPQYYTALLNKATEIISGIIEIIDEISKQKICVHESALIEPKEIADRVIGRFEQPGLQKILSGAKALKKGQKYGQKAKAGAEKIAMRAEQTLTKYIDPDDVQAGKDLVSSIIDGALEYMPGREQIEQARQRAEEITQLTVSLANLMIAADNFVIKLREFKASLGKIAGKDDEFCLGDYIVENPTMGKREKAKKAFEISRKINQSKEVSQDEIRLFQEFLVENGFFGETLNENDYLTGNYDEATYNAHKTCFDLMINNQAFAEDYLCRKQKNPEQNIVVTHNNPFVRQIQELLKNLGYMKYEDTVDGDFGGATFDAFEEFARDMTGESIGCETP
ncbi:peptidoglycan-binding protein [Patescibacteria group bacterium]|nr:peptidoglycan-binding protein [Patescibacteria group bacterium]MBU1703285.1 peptidoglycan-binding protein [Patescibacteria group bacterium]MBU1953384.1 peptidoglycan-binding protein [Patescibacteria group bacterium]